MRDVDPRRLAELTGFIYRAAYEAERWAEVVTLIRSQFHASKVCLQRSGPDLTEADTITTPTDPDYIRRLVEDPRLSNNIFADVLARMPAGRVYSDRRICGDLLGRSALYNEWMAPQDMHHGLTCKLAARGGSSWMLDLRRGARSTDFDGADAEIVDFLVPHIARAFEIGLGLKLERAMGSGLAGDTGVVLVDPSRLVLHADEAARRLFDRADGPLQMISGRLRGPPSVLRRLERAIDDACRRVDGVSCGRGGDFVLAAPGNELGASRRTLLVSIAPHVAEDVLPIVCARVVLRPMSLDLPPHAEARIARVFDLTPREARVGVRLAGGETLKAIAMAEGVELTTVRTQLSQLFRKTGTSQQSSLTSLLRLAAETSSSRA